MIVLGSGLPRAALAADAPAPRADLPEPGALLYPRGLDGRTVASVRKGLKYLANTQNRDGSWRSGGQTGGYPVAMTSLAGLALLAAGNTATQGQYAPQVSRAATFLARSCQKTGLIARPEEESRCMHGHGFALLFLGELYGMEADEHRQREIKSVLDRAIRLTARSQSRAGGWLYTPDSGGDEGSVTVTQVQGLRACRNAGIAVPKQTIDNAMRYLHDSRQPDGGIAYRAGQRGSRPPISAAAVVCWFNAGMYEAPAVKKAVEYCRQNVTAGGIGRRSGGHYFYAHLYMAQAMYLSSSRDFDAYFPKIRNALLGRQLGDGSWNGDSVGTVYGTAVALVILQLPYSYLPIMQR